MRNGQGFGCIVKRYKHYFNLCNVVVYLSRALDQLCVCVHESSKKKNVTFCKELSLFEEAWCTPDSWLALTALKNDVEVLGQHCIYCLEESFERWGRGGGGGGVVELLW